MAALLRQAHARGITPDYVTALLAAFDRRSERADQGFVPRSLADERRPQTPLDEPLTEREIEVLRLPAQGYSSEAIAAEFVVAVGTVKRHVANILGKLEVHSRLQAVASARDLGLL